MKSVYDAFKKPLLCHLRKDVLKKEVNTASVLAQRTNGPRIEDKIDISSNEKLYEKQISIYKPSIFQQKNHNFNHINQLGIKQVVLSEVIYRQFSIKVS